MYNILVVDDDKEIADSIKIYLEEEDTMYLNVMMEKKLLKS